MNHFLIFVVSLVGLLLSSNFVLESSEKIGKKLGLSPLTIGIFFIGFGTSLPELIVSHLACLEGRQEISLGNILGSNISNTALILGLAALVQNVNLKGKIQLKQILFHLFITCLLGVFYFFFKAFNPITGSIFLVFFAIYMWQIIFSNSSIVESIEDIPEENMLKAGGILLISLGLMFFSGKYLVSSISDLGRLLGISDYIISAVVLAFGTSAPELFTTIIATVKNKDVNLILGNILGSNVFNLCLVLGTTSFYTYSITHPLDFEIGVLLIMSLYLLAMSFFEGHLARKSGFVLLLIYAYSIFFWLS